MKLTNENSDGMDCRPPNKDPINMDLVPDHMKERIAKKVAQQALASRQGTEATMEHRPEAGGGENHEAD